MKLWIRSQDREELVKVDNIRVKHEYEQKKVNDNYGRTCAYVKGDYRCSYIYADSTLLGAYKTKERALEVLDEIQNEIKPEYMLRDINTGMTPQYEAYYEEKPTIVYEMPEE